MRPEIEQELAHTLLVELLAYQFASPVRWIETQDVILADRNTERIVEIGPANTLGNMAKRTIASKYEAYDAALSLQRQILCSAADGKEIYYEAEPEVEEAAPASTEGGSSTAPAPSAGAPAAGPAAAAAPPPPPSSGPAAAVPDAPITAVDVVRSLIAQKLKKPLADIPLSKAIKDLVGGKSTLQNEILGDLGKEFGSTPEKPEDTPLDELGASMQATFNGQLGKQSSSLIARMISSKMPGGFNITAARKYLETRWGLASGRQDGVLLLGLTMEPASRLGSENDAKAWLDDTANKYAASAGVNLSTVAGGGDAGAGGQGMMVDPAALDALTKDQRALFKQQIELLARYLKMDLRAGDKANVTSQESNKILQAQLDLWNTEHGDFYAEGIKPQFSSLKARVYDSAWNWVRQDALSMYYDIIFGRLKAVDRETVSQCIRIMNRSNPTLLEFMQYHIDNCPTDRGETYQLAKELGQQLIENCKEVLNVAPVYKDVAIPTGPQTTVDAQGNLEYNEVQRPSVRKLEHYVREMAEGGKISEYGNRTKVQADLARIFRLMKSQHMSKSSQLQLKQLYENVIRSMSMSGQIVPTENNNGKKLGLKSRTNGQIKPGKVETIPFLHLKRKDAQGSWEYSKKLTGVYLDTMTQAARDGVTFQGRYALMTGAGSGSIGAEILQGLISGGARVVVTTSRFSPTVTSYYQEIYARYGATGSQLIVVPFNQGSKQDVEALVEYIYDTKKGLGWDLDYVVPFAAIPENGREIDSIDSKSELAHRIMLTNLLRLLGCIKTQKQERGFETRPAQVMLPLSPNHGTFGNDGLYSESKLALETLFNRWYSENWSSFLTICGAVIGWTRGTGLMSGNNIVAEGLESYGVRTFSQQEMAFNILGLMSPAIVNLCQSEPVFADLNGGFQFLLNSKEIMTDLRKEIMERSEIRRAVTKETAIENEIINGKASESLYKTLKVKPRANIKFEFPQLPDWESDIKPLNAQLKDMVDLDRVVVFTGFGEVGPLGSSRTRWEMEAFGEFSLEGCLELAWMMKLIRWHNGPLKGKAYSGWVDSKTNEPVDEIDIKSKYEKEILEHTGIRLIEPELFGGYDPSRKQLLQEIVVEHDLEAFEASKETAEEYKREHGDKVDIFELESGEFSVRVRQGATLYVPKALRFDRLVAGQIPTGWDARTYGVPEDILTQVDPVTLYVLVTTVEALLSSGITDPYEFYKYVHLTEVGNCIGSGIGGTSALKGMYKTRFLDRPLQKDILQESFINTMSAWVNMLLLSSTGPIKTPVGACATAVESLDIGYDTIMEGKAKVCLVGGFDDFQEEGSYEFANMKATSNAEDEFAHGRTPKEMSRPTTTTRNGFMESQGCGMQVIMTAQLALDMGVPIHGILAFTATATDKIGRSVPAPGKGVLTAARERPGKFSSPLLDIKYRKRQLDLRRQQIKQWQESELMYMQEEVTVIKSSSDDSFNESEYMQERVAHIAKEAVRQEKEAQNSLGNTFWRRDPTIAPIRGALATWGLTIDDLDVASFHGTSTVANDKNESDVLNEQMKHLGRSKGNPLLSVWQKSLTGHAKGGAGGFMIAGALDIIRTGLVPGNRNADNVDKALEQYEYIVFPSRSIQTDGIKAFSVTSFGFGQKGTQALGIHPRYLFATLDQAQYAKYSEKVKIRQKKAYRYFHNGMITNSLFVAKTHSPYADDLEKKVFLDPQARVAFDNVVKELRYTPPKKDGATKSAKPDPRAEETKKMVENLANATALQQGGKSKVGVDVESIAAVNIENDTFMERNFTVGEIKYCKSQPNPQASFAGKWSAKEAVFKSLGVSSRGAGAAMGEIEVLNDEKGAPVVTLHGHAKKAAAEAGVKRIEVSITHDDVQAIAVAVSKF